MNNYKEEKFLKIPLHLTNFINTNTTKGKNNSGHDCYFFHGYVKLADDELIYECCGSKMYINLSNKVKIKHLPFGNTYSYICIDKKQLQCSKCGKTKMQTIPFQSENHYITKQLETTIKDYLSTNNFTNKEIFYLTEVDRNAIKDIDKERLIKPYTIKGEGKELIKPLQYARYLENNKF